MKSTAPPLNLLPAFEASARHLSFKQAAAELNVTPSAISQQIKQLENWVGLKLFERRTRALDLTEAGQQFYEIASDTLKRYHLGYEELRRRHTQPVIRLSTLGQIAIDILIPALPEFNKRHPDIDLRIETSETPVDFDTDGVELAVRIGLGDWAACESEVLCPLRASILASPKFIEKHNFTGIEDFRNLPLIHSRSDVNDWEHAARMMQLDISHNPQLFFQSNHAALTAAESGLGAVLALRPLVDQRLAQGRLKALFKADAQLESALYLVCQSHSDANNEQLNKVREWLKSCFTKLQKGASLPLPSRMIKPRKA